MKEHGRANCVFIQLRCKPGTTYKVADELYKREIASAIFSTSGEWDLMVQIFPPKDVDIGKFVNENISNIAGIERTLTTLTFTAF